MKKLLWMYWLEFGALTVWGAGAPLILDWGVVDTSSAEQQAMSRAVRTAARPVASQRRSRRGTAPWLVQFNGVIQEEWKTAMEAAGAELKGYFPENAYLVEASPKSIAIIGALAEVAWVGEYLPAYKRARMVREHLAKGTGATREYNVILFRPEDAEDLAQEIAGIPGARVNLFEPMTDRGLVRAQLPAAAVETVTGWSEVEWVEAYIEPRLLNDVAVRPNKMNVSNAWTTLGLTGAGQTIAVCDTGLDTGNLGTLHRDFTNRVAWTQALGRNNNWSDPDGHGTHVAGSVLGGGILSTGKYKGVAYEASLVFQSVLNSSGGLALPSDLNTLFRAAFTNGARIHSDSWGAAVAGEYTANSRNLDMFVWSNRTMLVVMAAGNEGIDANNNGVVDLDSMSSPGTAKNCLTVGAAENYRTTGGYSTYGWGALWPSDYPTAPIKTDYTSRPDSPQGMAAFSSRGPCDDGRIKPDIVAPGTDIISTRSRATTDEGWGLLTSNTNYLYMGGTSMATPLTAGAAGLARQWALTTGGIANPSAALIKALLINGARNLAPGQYGTGTTQEIPNTRPNNVQGWGHVDLFNTLQPAANQFLDLHDTNSLSVNQTNTFALTVNTASTNKFILTMAYSDYWAAIGAGTKLVNDLDLTVKKPSGGILYANGSTSLDSTNNVELIEFAADEVGTYTVRVVARNVPSGGSQPYALIIRGPAANTIPTAPGFGANPGPISATAGVAVAFTVGASGSPAPTLALQSTTASSGYTFTPGAGTGQLNYTPPVADGDTTRTFTFTASNSAGVATQTVSVGVAAGIPAAPAPVWASATNATDFTAEWGAVAGARSYRLDVSTNADFSGGGATAGELFISEYIEGGGNNKYIEIFNGTGNAVDLSNYRLIQFNNGSATPSYTLDLSGTLADADVYVLENSSEALGVAADLSTSSQLMTFNGDDAIALSNKSAGGYADIFGRIGEDPGSAWIDGSFTTVNKTLVRKSSVAGGVTANPASGFALLGTEWDQYNQDTVSYLGSHTFEGGGGTAPSYVSGYANLEVSGTSQIVAGLEVARTYYFRVRAVNAAGTSPNSSTANVMTVAGNSAPTFAANPGPLNATIDVAMAFTVAASGVPEPTLALQSTTAPPGYYGFSPDAGRLNYTPAAFDLGPQTFTFTASNSVGVATQTVTVMVGIAQQAAPVVDPIPPQSTLAGATLNYTVTATDPDSATVTFSCTSATASSTWTINPGSGAFTFAPTPSQVGTHVFTFKATDNTALESSPVDMVVVVNAEANQVAVSFGQTRIVAEEGGAFAVIPVNLAYAGNASVQIRFTGPPTGTAQRGVDFNCVTTLVISGISSNLYLDIVDDPLAEGPESVKVTLVPVSPATAGATTEANLYIRDNDTVSILAANLTSGANQEYEDHGNRILQALCPDVVLIQEFNLTNGTSDTAYRTWVNQNFGTNYYYCHEPLSSANIPNGIVSRWPIIQSGEWDDPTLTDRDFAWAKIQLPGGVPLYAVSLHIKASAGYESQRTTEARALTNYIAQAGWLTNGGYIALGGDFNLQVRNEIALQVLTNKVVTDKRQPADQNNNKNTNSGRDNPYDLVLPSTNLDARHRTFAFWGQTFTNGIVFDTRLPWANGLPPPALATNSAALNMQHMGVMKVFELEAVSAANQTIDFPQIGGQLTTNTVYLSASASSGLQVSFAVASGPAVITGGTTLTFTGAGMVSIVAAQAGNGSWNPAPNVTNTFAVTKATAPVTLVGLGQIYNGTARIVTATTVPSGLTVDITYNGGTTAPTNAGSYAVTGTVNSAMYQGLASGTLVVSPASQTIAFSAIGAQLATNTVNLSATASSGLPVSFAVASGPAAISGGNSLTFTGAGTVSIVASQAGNGNWVAAANVTNTFGVTKATAAVTLVGLAPTYDGSARIVTATTIPSGLAVDITYDGGAVAPTNAGSYVVTGTVSDLRYQGSAAGMLVVSQAAATVALHGLAQTYDGTSRAISASTVPADLAVWLTYGGQAWAPTNAGSYAVTATVSDANFAGSAVGTLEVAKADQEINFPAIGDPLATDTVELSAAASSGLPVSFAVVSGLAEIAVDGVTLTFTGAGEVTIRATQSGDGNWNAAETVVRTFHVSSASLGLQVSRTEVNVRENGQGRFYVKLDMAPEANTVATVARTAGDGNITVADGALLTFTPANWNIWQPVTLAAANDADDIDGPAEITVTAAGTTPVVVTATELDDDISDNLALASAGSTITGSYAARTIDGIHNSSANYGYATWTEPAKPMVLDLKAAVPVSRIRLLNWDWGYREHRYTIESSLDGTDWTPLVDTGAAVQRGWDDWELKDVMLRYLRFTGVTNTVNYAVCVAEWEVYQSEEPELPPVPAPMVSRTEVNVRENGQGRFYVKLDMAPEANTVATVARTAGDGDITVAGGALLTFTPANWNIWQPVTLAGANDADDFDGPAEITVTAAGATPVVVTTTELDDDIGDNLALASAGSTITGPYATRTIDGIHDSSANYGYATWTEPAKPMVLDLKAAVTVSRIRLLNWDWGYRLHRYTIEYSRNGTDWTPLATSGAAAQRGWDDWTVEEVSLQFLRFTGLENSINFAVCVAELEVYGPPPGPLSMRKAVAKSLESEPVSVLTSDGPEDQSGWYAVDGDATTAWVGQKTGGGYLVIEYQPALDLAALEVDLAEDSLAGMEALTSLDGVEWQPLPEDAATKPVCLNFLWLVFPDYGSAAVPNVLEIWPNP